MNQINVEYNHDLQPLTALLANVTNPGDFYIDGTLEIPMPRLEVEGIGALSFPIPHPQLETLVHHATPAPYGRGPETLIDPAVRNVRQIPPDAVKISGKSWPTTFHEILSQVTAGLGCHHATVSAELYKLLIYPPGGFFLAHRDTEKAPGMFATLVLTLPSAHRGGALRIRHAGREVTIASHAADPSELAFAAFYADCEHEVLPVREGYRVCLVYNLIQSPAATAAPSPQAPNYAPQIDQAAALLAAFWQSPGPARKLAWLLDHQYSPAGLTGSALKGADLAKARVLRQAAARAGCDLHLAVVHIGESGAAEITDYGFHGSRRARYRYPFEPDDEVQHARFEAITVDDGWRYLDHWSDQYDRPVAFGRIPLADSELLPAHALDEEPPDEQRLTEATGNEGASYERSYRRAALVLWPARQTVDVLLAGGLSPAISYLTRVIAEDESARPHAAVAAAAARQIVEQWRNASSPSTGYSLRQATRPADRSAMLAILTDLHESDLLVAFVRQAVLPAYDGSENAHLLRAAAILSDTQAAALLAALIRNALPNHPAPSAELLQALANNPSPSYLAVADAAVAALDATPPLPSDPTPDFLANLLSALCRFGDGSRAIAAAGAIAAHPERFPPVSTVVPALERLFATPAAPASALPRALETLWNSAAEDLLSRSEHPPRPPADWRLHAKISCSCADCAELQAFANSPTEITHRFRVKQERRSHLHRIIEAHGLDMTHLTERTGSPQTLVCTKDRRTFKARTLQYRAEVASMRTLLQRKEYAVSHAGLFRRLQAAVQPGPS